MPNLLITSAGRRVSLVQYFKSEAQALLGVSAKVFTTDLQPQLAPACLVSDGYFAVGHFEDVDYMDKLLRICIDNNIELVIPTLDTELKLYANERERFLSKGIILLVSDVEVVNTFRCKASTFQFFQQRAIATPRVLQRQSLIFPLFIKPNGGSSSKGAMCIRQRDELSPAMMMDDSLLFLEYLSPAEFDEYTVDLYYNRRGELKGCVPRLRLEVRHGEMSKGITCRNHVVDYVKEHFSELQGVRGVISLQLFSHKKEHRVVASEINLRFGGGYPLSHLAGANYVRAVIEEYLLDKEVESLNKWEDGLIDLRYDVEMVVGKAGNSK